MSDPESTVEGAPLSDNAKRAILVEAGLFTRDPSSYPDLSLRMDPQRGLDQSFRPVAYDTRHTTGEMVHCSICAQRQEHFDGAIVRLGDGSVGLVGNDCGRRHFFGEAGWTAITNRLRQDSEQAIFVARFGAAKERIGALDELLREWATDLRTVHGIGNRFEAQLPQLFAAIRREGRGGMLHLAQEQQVPFHKANGDVAMRTEIQQIAVCRVEPLWFFLREDLPGAIERSRTQLCQAVGFLHAEAKPHNVAAVKKMIRDCRRRLEDVAAQQLRLKSLTTEKVIAQLASWGSATLGGKDAYSAFGKRIERSRGGVAAGDVDLGLIPAGLSSHWEAVKASWPSL